MDAAFASAPARNRAAACVLRTSLMAAY
uniref:Uncharacterized protein n=1 Tax=Arundo donax TaxID=35708 RepID=A0A0A9F2K5_ARUDO